VLQPSIRLRTQIANPDLCPPGGTRYSALTTSLLAQSELTVQQVEDALKNEEAHRVGLLLLLLLPLLLAWLSNSCSSVGCCLRLLWQELDILLSAASSLRVQQEGQGRGRQRGEF
jgi:hypothetical protein